MKEHLLNLIYLQFQQEQQLVKLCSGENDDIDVYDAHVDILGVALDIIGYPKEGEYENHSRDYFYQKLTDIAMEYEDNILAKEQIEDFFSWICGETLELYKNYKLKTDDFLKNIMDLH